MARWHNCPSLAVFWCNGIFIVFYLYTIYAASTRYNNFKINAGNPKYGFGWNETYFSFYLGSILVACLFWLLFLYSSIFQTGNLANDYVELGNISTVIEDPINSTKVLATIRRILQRVRYHFIPFNAMLHLFGAFFLLVPIPLLIEEEVKHGINNFDPEHSSSFLLCIYIPEIINFLLAAFCLIVRLPTVFSTVSKSFGIIFSVMIFVSTTNIFIHCISNQIIVSQKSKFNWRIALSNIPIFFISLTNFCFIYEHGRLRFIESNFICRIDTQDQGSSKSGLTSFERSKVERYWPNVTALCMLIVLVALYIDQYCINILPSVIYLFDICVSITHCLVWLIIWVLFTFKSDWEFSGQQNQIKVIRVTRENTFKTPQLSLNPNDTMYTCFQISDQIRSTSSHSSKTPNLDVSSASSSNSSGRVSEKTSLHNQIPSISNQLEYNDCNYDDVMFKPNIRSSKNMLKEIPEEKADYQEIYKTRSQMSPSDLDYFKSPNVSQRSSNIHSSDSGIGINFRENPDYVFTTKVPEHEILKYRSYSSQGILMSKALEYNIDEELLDPTEVSNNLCSDV